MIGFRPFPGGLPFVQTCKKLKNIKIGGLEYNYWNLESFIIRQCASSLKAFLMANNGNLDSLLEIIEKATLSKKHEEMLAQMEIGGFYGGKGKSKMREDVGQGGTVHRAIPRGQLFGEAGELHPGHGGTAGTARTGLEPAPGGDQPEAPAAPDHP